MKLLNEFVSEEPTETEPASGTPGPRKIDDLFFGSRRQLKDAQSKLHQLLELLQDGHNGVDASEVADLIKAVAKAISEMDSMANAWQQKAREARMGEGVDFDASEYVQGQLYFEHAKSMDELLKGTEFEFDRLLGDIADEA